MVYPVASLSISSDRIIYTAPSFTAKPTSRPAMVVLVGTRAAVRLVTESECHMGRILLVAPNVRRSIEARDAGLYSIQLDPASALCQYLLKQIMMGRQIVDLSSRASERVMRIAETALSNGQECEAVIAGSEQILNALFPEAARWQSTDARVDAVASWLSTHVPARSGLRRLAAMCDLSESRLAYVFASATGNSMREYLLWVKMRKAAEMFAAGSTHTEIAHATGFADLSHLSRTFKRYFDLTPSFLRNPSFVCVRISKELSGQPQCSLPAALA